LRLKILKKLRTVSLNSEFIGSYKKSVIFYTINAKTSKLQKLLNIKDLKFGIYWIKNKTLQNN